MPVVLISRHSPAAHVFYTSDLPHRERTGNQHALARHTPDRMGFSAVDDGYRHVCVYHHPSRAVLPVTVIAAERASLAII